MRMAYSSAMLQARRLCAPAKCVCRQAFNQMRGLSRAIPKSCRAFGHLGKVRIVLFAFVMRINACLGLQSQYPYCPESGAHHLVGALPFDSSILIFSSAKKPFTWHILWRVENRVCHLAHAHCVGLLLRALKHTAISPTEASLPQGVCHLEPFFIVRAALCSLIYKGFIGVRVPRR